MVVARRVFEQDEAREIEAIASDEVKEMAQEQEKVANNRFAAASAKVIGSAAIGARSKISGIAGRIGLPFTIGGIIKRGLEEEFRVAGGQFEAALKARGVAALQAQNPEFGEILDLARGIGTAGGKAGLLKALLDAKKFGAGGLAALNAAVTATFQGRDVAGAAERAFYDANPWVVPPELKQEFTELHIDQKRRLKEVPVTSGIIGG